MSASSPNDEHATKHDRFGTLPLEDAPTHRDPYITQAAGASARGGQAPRFTVLRFHQKGGLGRLLVALDAELNREIALKEILPAFADDEESRRRFIREAEITGALEHPGIVPVYSLGEYPDGRPYYAMRFVRGVDLLTAIEDFYKQPQAGGEREFQFRQLLSRFIAVCRAIDYAHHRGVIHRDLKPSNVMLGEFGETLLVDWGLARAANDPEAGGRPPSTSAAKSLSELPPVSPSERAASDRTQAGRVVGTLAYMSPEQAAGRLDLIGPASDVYGLGATLYHLLTGQAAFDNDRDESLLRVQQGRFSAPREVAASLPRPLEAICLKAMAREPQQRYASAGELALDLERYLADEPATAYTEPWTARAWRWTRRHRTLVMSSMAAAAVAVVALSTGIALLSAANERERKARDAANENYETSIVERDRAERNFELAQDAVRQYFVRVSEETLLNQPGMQPLRDSLLRQALGYFEKFLAERGNDSQLKQEAAQAQFYVGRIAETIDSAVAALPHYEKAAELQKELLASAAEAGKNDGAVGSLQVEYAQTLNAVGRVMQKDGRPEEATKFYRQAADLREQLSRKTPDDVDRARELASSLMNLGLIALEQGDSSEGIKQLERAQAVRLAHDSATEPNNAPLVRDIGVGYFNLGSALLSQGQVSAGAAKLHSAIAAFERVRAAAPNDLENSRRLASAWRMLGDAEASRKRGKNAADDYRKAASDLEMLSLRNPDVPEYAADLAGVKMNLGRLLADKGEAEGLAQILAAADLLAPLAAVDDALPRRQRDYGVARRAAGEILFAQFRQAEAREQLEKSRDALAKLVRENPQNQDFAKELTKTAELIEKLDAK